MIAYRPARREDADAIALLHTRSWRENYRGSLTDAFLDGELPEERLAVWRGRLEDPVESQFVQLALLGDELVGFVCAYGAEDPHWGSLIDNLHVARSAKRRGVGASLMRAAGDWLGSAHPEHPVYLWVLEANGVARRFYESLGAANAGVCVMETHGGAVVRSCRYTWPSGRALARSGPT